VASGPASREPGSASAARRMIGRKTINDHSNCCSFTTSA
jgi:hypothetical protein